MYIAILMIVPLLVGIVCLVLSKTGQADAHLSLKEFGIMEGACLLIFMAGMAIARYTSVSDTELISGRVTDKQRNEVSCSHSYECNCYDSCTSDEKGGQSCTRICQTCYEHSYDVDWDVFTNAMGKNFEVDRLDSQGLREPPRWSEILVGEPVAVEHGFQNFLKADPASVLLRRGVTIPKGLELPKYPNQTYDYYRANRFIQVGLQDPNERQWNDLLMDMNGDLGPTKQANVIVVEVKSTDPSYEFVVEQEWMNGKKNDIIVVLGISEYPKIDWVRIVSWTKSEELKVELRDDLMEAGSVQDPTRLANIIKASVVSKFSRRHFKEFEYMQAAVRPSTTAWILMMIFGFGTCFGLTWFFWHNDPFEDEEAPRYRVPYRRRY